MFLLKKYFILALLTCLIFQTSCKKESININNKKKDIEVINGTLHLKDQSVLDSLVNELEAKTYLERKQWGDSIGFISYETYYEDLFFEYESIIEEVIQKRDITPLETFISLNKENANFPSEKIDGEPNFNIEPKYSSNYNFLLSADGELYINNNKYSSNNQLKSTSSLLYDTCYKATSSRRMWVKAWYDGYSTSNKVHLYSFELKGSKKSWFGWRSYKTVYYYKTVPDSNWNSWGKLSSGTRRSLHSPYQIHPFMIANDGVGKSRACTVLD